MIAMHKVSDLATSLTSHVWVCATFWGEKLTSHHQEFTTIMPWCPDNARHRRTGQLVNSLGLSMAQKMIVVHTGKGALLELRRDFGRSTWRVYVSRCVHWKLQPHDDSVRHHIYTNSFWRVGLSSIFTFFFFFPRLQSCIIFETSKLRLVRIRNHQNLELREYNLTWALGSANIIHNTKA